MQVSGVFPISIYQVRLCYFLSPCVTGGGRVLMRGFGPCPAGGDGGAPGAEFANGHHMNGNDAGNHNMIGLLNRLSASIPLLREA